MLSLGDTCSIIFIPLASSASSFVWQIISALWPYNWIWITLLLIGWIIWELSTRNGTAHYNSQNGFSPSFNRFVGSGSYLGIQSLLILSFSKFFGDVAYCFIWPYSVHVLIFALTGLTLHLSGFWPYLMEPGTKKSSKRYKRHKRRYR